MDVKNIENFEDVKEVVSRGESQFIEFKKSIAELDSLGKTLCGFLNGRGGVGLVGVTDTGKLLRLR